MAESMGRTRAMFGSTIGAIVVAMFVGSATALPTHQQQFDLICKLHANIYRKRHPERFGTAYYLGDPNWPPASHFVVDVPRKLDDIFPAKAANVSPIYKIAGKRVIFQGDPDLHEYYDLSSHKYYRDEVLDYERSARTTGHCRLAKFSGFPAVPARKAGRQ